MSGPAAVDPAAGRVARWANGGDAVEILEDYLSGLSELRAAYEGMSEDQLHARPVEGKWSAMEVLCHLVDTDLMTATRIRAAHRGKSPSCRRRRPRS